MAALCVTFIVIWNAISGCEMANQLQNQSTNQMVHQADQAETAILGGGCFWCLEAVYLEVLGVTKVESGYMGGHETDPSYEQVCAGTTGHAEVVRLEFDPQQIGYRDILEIFFTIHDPTTLNRQGNDAGTQYRSAIFAQNADQQIVAQAYIAQLDAAKSFDKPIVTQIEMGKSFYPAESYHQDFLTENPSYPYIVINDLPKVAQLKKLFPDQYRAEPVLVKHQ